LNTKEATKKIEDELCNVVFAESFDEDKIEKLIKKYVPEAVINCIYFEDTHSLKIIVATVKELLEFWVTSVKKS
jgi:ribosomal protein L7Ae-like RNA K-turn-binding protein